MVAVGLLLPVIWLAPDQLPEWVGRKTWLQGRQLLVVVTGPYWPSRERALTEALTAGGQRLSELQLPWVDGRVRELLARTETVQSLVRENIGETRSRDYGTVYRVHLLLSIGPKEQERLVQAADALRREHADRWVARAILMSMVLLAVCVFYGRADRATRGYMTGRLRLFAALAIAAGAYGVWQLV